MKTDQVEVSLQITSIKYTGTNNAKDDLNCYVRLNRKCSSDNIKLLKKIMKLLQIDLDGMQNVVSSNLIFAFPRKL